MTKTQGRAALLLLVSIFFNSYPAEGYSLFGQVVFLMILAYTVYVIAAGE